MDCETLAVLGIAASPVVALISFFVGLTVRRPKLVSSGGGSGTIQVPDKDIMASSVTIRNEPTFLGIKVPREAADIDHARLYDPELKEYVGPVLRWQQEGTRELARQTTIAAGGTASLYVFGKERYSEKFFIFNLAATNASLPQQLFTYSAKRKDYSLILFDSIQRTYKFNIRVRNTPQSVAINFKITWRSRWEMIKDAARSLRRAFSVSRSR